MNMIRYVSILCLLLAATLSAQDKKTAAKVERFDFRPLMQTDLGRVGNPESGEHRQVLFERCEAHFLRSCAAEVHGLERISGGREKVVYRLFVRQVHAVRRRARGAARKLRLGGGTGHGTLVKKSGGKDDFDFRWTVLWEKDGNDWLIIHEHVSVPMVAATKK